MSPCLGQEVPGALRGVQPVDEAEVEEVRRGKVGGRSGREWRLQPTRRLFGGGQRGPPLGPPAAGSWELGLWAKVLTRSEPVSSPGKPV